MTSDTDKTKNYLEILKQTLCIRLLKSTWKTTQDLDVENNNDGSVNNFSSDEKDEVKLLVSSLPGKTNEEKALALFKEIQLSVNSLYDTNMNRLNAKADAKGIKQVIFSS